VKDFREGSWWCNDDDGSVILVKQLQKRHSVCAANAQLITVHTRTMHHCYRF